MLSFVFGRVVFPDFDTPFERPRFGLRGSDGDGARFVTAIGQQGIGNLDGVLGFLTTVLPALRELEEATGRDVPPAGLYLSPEAT